MKYSHILLQNKEIIKTCVSQKAKISKLEKKSSKSPSQLRLAREHLFRRTARGVLFSFVAMLLIKISLFAFLIFH